MTEKENIEKLASLTNRQREVLRLFCNGFAYKEIAEQLFISENTVKTHMGNIYIKLGLDLLPDSQRKREIHQKYCQALDTFEIKPKPSVESEEPEPVPEPVPEHVWEMVENDEKAIVPVPPTEIIDINPIQEQNQPRRFRWFLLGVIIGSLVAICAGIGVWQLFPVLFPTPGLTTSTAMPRETVIPVVLPTDTVLTSATMQAEFTSSATPMVQEDTLAASATPITPTPTPAFVVLFEDNFDRGLSPLWQIISGNPSVVNGALTTDGELWLMVGDETWKNYFVEYDTQTAYCWMSWDYNGVGLHARNQNNMVVFYYAQCEGAWNVVQGGNKKKIPNAEFEGPTIGKIVYKMKFSVENNQYLVDIRGDTVSIFDQTFENGGVIIRLSEKSIIDNFRVVAIP